MILTQFVILSCYTRGAVVQVANSQIFTAKRYHRASAEAKTFRAKNRCFDDIDTRFQAAIDLQTDLVTQAVGNQRLLGFNKPQLPRTAWRISPMKADLRRCRRHSLAMVIKSA